MDSAGVGVGGAHPPPPPPLPSSYQNSSPPAASAAAAAIVIMNGAGAPPPQQQTTQTSSSSPPYEQSRAPDDDGEAIEEQQQQQQRQQRRHRSSSTNNHRRRRSRSTSALLSVVRRAFFSVENSNSSNVSYSVPPRADSSSENDAAADGDVFDNDDDDDNNDSPFMDDDDRYDDPAPRRWLLGAFAVLVILAATSLSLKQHRKVITPAQNNDNDTNDDDGDNSICREKGAAAALFASSSFVGDLEHAAVATDQAICSQLATKIMMDSGGNAVDAAITAALCLGVANPSSSGLGGGAFMLVHAVPTVSSETDDLPDHIDARDDSNSNNNNNSTKEETIGSNNNKITEVIDCRETAPAAAFTGMYDGRPAADASVRGGLAVAVWGELKCLELAHAKFGQLPWRDVVEPAAQLAQQGVPVSKYLARVLRDVAEKAQKKDDADGAAKNDDDYGLRNLFTRTGGDWTTVLREGQLLQNGALAATLRDVQQRGADALYTGDRAAQLAREIQNAGGVVTADDLRNCRATLRSPVETVVNGFRLVGLPPPSSGGAAVLGAAQFLGGFAVPLSTYAGTLSRHRIVEAFKHVFAVRLSLSDPDSSDAARQVCRDAVADLTSPEYMSMLRNAAYQDNATLPLSVYGGAKWAQLNDTDADATGQNATDAQEGDRRRRQRQRRQRRQLLSEFGYLEDGGTSHFSIVDAAGNAVAMTTSINTVFGSAVVSPSTGIIFGNTMDDFGKPGLPNHYGLKPAEANFIQPGKKPLSSMSPTLVFRQSDDAIAVPDQLVLALGASGGPKIITAVTQVLLHHIILGLPLLESVAHPRLHDQLIYHDSAVTATEKVELDDGDGDGSRVTIDVPQRTRDALTRRGHALLDVNYMGTVQAVSVDTETGRLSAACDPRKGGSPAGY